MDLSEYNAITDANCLAYEACRDFLSAEHLGEYVLIYGGKIQGFYPSESEASLVGGAANPCAVMRIVPTGQPIVDRGPIRHRPLKASLPDAA